MKKKTYRHVTILEESYNADKQAQEAESFKRTLKKGAKKIGCGCLSILLIVPVVGLLVAFWICFPWERSSSSLFFFMSFSFGSILFNLLIFFYSLTLYIPLFSIAFWIASCSSSEMVYFDFPFSTGFA